MSKKIRNANRQGFLHMGSSNPKEFLDQVKEGTAVVDRDGTIFGHTTGAHFRCRMEGCLGWRVTVKWPDKKVTHPCSKGMVYGKGKWKII